MAATSSAEAPPRRASMSIWAVIALGVGSMVGAGIFALLGQTALLVGRETWLAFAIGGAVALLSGVSYASLSAHYPSNGGIVDFFDRGLPRWISGALSLLFLVNLAVSTAMIAKTFGAYGVKLAGATGPSRLDDLVGSVAVVVLYLLTTVGRSAVGRAELILVGTKVVILLAFMTGGLWYLDLDAHSRHAPATSTTLIASVGLTFFAYAGYGIMANAAGNVRNPGRTMLIAFPVAIGFTAFLYVSLALIVLAAIPPEELAANADTAIAQAAEPYFGRAGFVIMSIAALLATASTINANIYSGNEMSRSLAAAAQLPSGAGHPLLGSGTRGLLAGVVLVLVLVNVFDLATVANAAGATFLIVYVAVYVVVWRLRGETGTSAAVILLGTGAMAVVLATFLWSLWEGQPAALAIIAGAIVIAAVLQFLVAKTRPATA
jgi:amino acid transporter